MTDKTRTSPKEGAQPTNRESEMNAIGTICATPKNLTAADRHADRMRANSAKAAEKLCEGMDKRIVRGEVRYYKTANIYTTNGKNWFEVRADGDYSIRV